MGELHLPAMAPKLSKVMKASSKVLKDEPSPKKSSKKGSDAEVVPLAMKAMKAMKATPDCVKKPAGLRRQCVVVCLLICL